MMQRLQLSNRGLARTAILALCLGGTGTYAEPRTGGGANARLAAAEAPPMAPVDRRRGIPEDALKGVMWPPQGRKARINDTIKTLAPGVTIRDMNNRLVLPGSLRNPKKIRYTLDTYGYVRRIWISPSGEYLGRHRPAAPPSPRE